MCGIVSTLPEKVVSAPTVNSFKNRLDKLLQNQELKYDYKATLSLWRYYQNSSVHEELDIEVFDTWIQIHPKVGVQVILVMNFTFLSRDFRFYLIWKWCTKILSKTALSFSDLTERRCTLVCIKCKSSARNFFFLLPIQFQRCLSLSVISSLSAPLRAVVDDFFGVFTWFYVSFC